MNCPNCGHLIEQDFGVVTCVGCQAVLFIDLQGNVQISNDEPAAEAKLVPELPIFETLANEEAAPVTVPLTPPLPEPALETIAVVAPVQAPEFSPAPSAPEELGRSFTEDVLDYANSENIDGRISYEIVIQNIDTADIRDLVLDALSDRRFRWDARDLISAVRRGRLVLSKIHPVKASILIRRLGAVPVTITWQQQYLK